MMDSVNCFHGVRHSLNCGVSSFRYTGHRHFVFIVQEGLKAFKSVLKGLKAGRVVLPFVYFFSNTLTKSSSLRTVDA